MKKLLLIPIIFLTILSGCTQTVEPEEDATLEQLNNLIRLQQGMIDLYVAMLEDQNQASTENNEISLLRLTLSNQQSLIDTYLEEIKTLNQLIEDGETLIIGDYNPGIYFGYSVGNEPSIAIVTVGANGKIINVLIDTVYLLRETDGPLTWVSRGNEVQGIAITKRAYDNGCSYNMHAAKQVVNCQVDGELMWWQQVDLIAAAVVENQGLPNWSLVEDKISGDDAVAGVTITVGGYIAALQNALNQAKD